MYVCACVCAQSVYPSRRSTHTDDSALFMVRVWPRPHQNTNRPPKLKLLHEFRTSWPESFRFVSSPQISGSTSLFFTLTIKATLPLTFSTENPTRLTSDPSFQMNPITCLPTDFSQTTWIPGFKSFCNYFEICGKIRQMIIGLWIKKTKSKWAQIDHSLSTGSDPSLCRVSMVTPVLLFFWSMISNLCLYYSTASMLLLLTSEWFWACCCFLISMWHHRLLYNLTPPLTLTPCQPMVTHLAPVSLLS